MAALNKTRRPVSRTISIVESKGDWFLLELVQQFPRTARTDYYLAREIPAAWGRGFALEKQDAVGTAAVYHVNIDGPEDSCDCRGHGRYGYCKHSAGLRSLIKAGRVPQQAKPGAVVIPFPNPGRSAASA